MSNKFKCTKCGTSMLVTGKMCIVCRTKMEKQAALDELSPYEEYEEFGLTEEEMLGYTPGDQ